MDYQSPEHSVVAEYQETGSVSFWNGANLALSAVGTVGGVKLSANYANKFARKYGIDGQSIWNHIRYDNRGMADLSYFKKSGKGTLSNEIPNNPQTVHRFMSKQEYKQFKKNGFIFNPKDSIGGISSTSTKNIFFKGMTKGGVPDWKIQDNVDVSDIINSEK